MCNYLLFSFADNRAHQLRKHIILRLTNALKYSKTDYEIKIYSDAIQNVASEIKTGKKVNKHYKILIESYEDVKVFTKLPYLMSIHGMNKNNESHVLRTINENSNFIRNYEMLAKDNAVDIINISCLKSKLFSNSDRRRLESYRASLSTNISCKCQVGLGLILGEQVDGVLEIRYWRPSYTSGCLFDSPLDLNNIGNFISKINGFDITELAQRSAPQDRASSTKVLCIVQTTLFIYKTSRINNPNQIGRGLTLFLPKHIVNLRTVHKLVNRLDLNVRTTKKITDYNCLFRCLALAKLYEKKKDKKMSVSEWVEIEKNSNNYFHSWLDHTDLDEQQFCGVKDDDYHDFSSFFNAKIVLYEKYQDGGVKQIYTSDINVNKNTVTVNCLIYNNHAMFIHNIQAFTGLFYCSACLMNFRDKFNLHQHYESKKCKNKKDNQKNNEGSTLFLPKHIVNLRTIHKLVNRLDLNVKTTKKITDYNCLFRCLALAKLYEKKKTKK